VLFVDALARAHKWDRIYIISPWISAFDLPGVMTFSQLLKRVRDEQVNLYVVTRPPIEPWHKSAVDQLCESGGANVRLMPSLHTKLFFADTAQGAFALVGSANFTNKSFENREIGVLIRSAGGGKNLVRELAYEAAEIYRSPGSIKVSRKLA
jgi:phosphatidylserine/phosphatidylglycerophosphate/cardiolipin synthase-like enzyme